MLRRLWLGGVIASAAFVLGSGGIAMAQTAPAIPTLDFSSFSTTLGTYFTGVGVIIVAAVASVVGVRYGKKLFRHAGG